MTHTVNTQDIIEISLEANETLDILHSLISIQLEDNGQDLKFSYILVLMCELVWINGTILHILRKDFQDLVFKDEDQKEVVVTKSTLDSLSTLMVAKWKATIELNSFSYSVCLN